MVEFRWHAQCLIPKIRRASERACDLAAGAARAGRDALDQLPVRCHLGAVRLIEGILKPGAQMAAEIGATLMQRPDFRTSDRGHLPMRLRQLQLEQDRQQFRIGRHAGRHAHHKIIFQRPRIHPGLPVHPDAAHDADIEALEFGNRIRRFHDVEIILHLLDRVIEHHRRPRPGVVAFDLQVIQRAGVAGRHLRPGLAHAIERAGIIRTRRTRGVVDDDARAGFADRLLDVAGHADLPRRQMSLVRRLLAQMDVHDAGAGIEGGARLARHLLRRDRNMMLFRIGQHAVQRAGDDGLVAHETAFDCSLVKRVPLTRSLRQNTATGSDVTDANPHDSPQAPSRTAAPPSADRPPGFRPRPPA